MVAPVKEFVDMDRDELLRALDLARVSADAAWRAANQLAKEKLIAERRYLPQFVNANK
jgi:hypothetical protein